MWFIILWTRAHPQNEPGTQAISMLPLLVLLAGSALNAVGLFVMAMGLNDLVDMRRDMALHPERPLPSGRLSLDTAVMLIVCSFGAAVLGATLLGIPAVLLTLVVGGAVLFFNAAGKFVPAIGLVLLGLIYAGQMVVPNLNLKFVLPVWLVMTHALLVAAGVHVLGRKSPGISVRATLLAIAGWAFWSLVMFGFGWYRNRPSSPLPSGQAVASGPLSLDSSSDSWMAGAVWPDWVSWTAGIGPFLLAIVFMALAWRRVHLLGRGPRVGEKIARYGALWLPLYGAAWMFGVGATKGGILLTVLAFLGLLGMTVVREAVALIEQPMGYRRS